MDVKVEERPPRKRILRVLADGTIVADLGLSFVSYGGEGHRLRRRLGLE